MTTTQTLTKTIETQITDLKIPDHLLNTVKDMLNEIGISVNIEEMEITDKVTNIIITHHIN